MATWAGVIYVAFVVDTVSHRIVGRSASTSKETQVEPATVEWVDWYCHRRLHDEMGHVPPVEYENNHYLETTKPQVTTTI